MWREGDLVTRKSYGEDVLFRIEALERHLALLKGVEFRLLADAAYSDLVRVAEPAQHRPTENVRLKAAEFARTIELSRERDRTVAAPDRPPFFELPGKVLHLDGDANYLNKCLQVYRNLGIPAVGHHVHESMMAEAVYRLLPEVKPDILVITGHDGLVRRPGVDRHFIGNYKNSHHFVNAVKIARQYERNRDALAVIAGACQSHFEALLQAGANFASSPARILIHYLDPVYVAAKVAFTSIRDTVNIYSVIRHTVSGLDGLGGIETKGSHRVGLPRLEY
jgi:spore coat assembly protein